VEKTGVLIHSGHAIPQAPMLMLRVFQHQIIINGKHPAPCLV
jgi:hypothetical protein